MHFTVNLGGTRQKEKELLKFRRNPLNLNLQAKDFLTKLEWYWRNVDFLILKISVNLKSEEYKKPHHLQNWNT